MYAADESRLPDEDCPVIRWRWRDRLIWIVNGKRADMQHIVRQGPSAQRHSPSASSSFRADISLFSRFDEGQLSAVAFNNNWSTLSTHTQDPISARPYIHI